uniref:Uncharacterized protein n=1 Tax=Anguilla anguilla TaxID=7936 RepID=A0A0E9QCI7_ANGAN
MHVYLYKYSHIFILISTAENLLLHSTQVV